MKKTFYNVHSLGEKMVSFLGPELKRRNFHDERLFLNWKYILGTAAEKMRPYKIVFNGIDENGLVQKTLFVLTDDRQFATEFSFYKTQFLNELNQYFGTKKSFFKEIKIKLLTN